MNIFFVTIYFICFALIAGGAFAMMWANVRSTIKEMDKPKPRHPEAPQPGDEVMYVDVSRQNTDDFQQTKKRLEDIYNA